MFISIITRNCKSQVLLFRILISSCILLIVACSTEKGAIQGQELHLDDYFTDEGFGNPISPLQQPAGEYHKGITYLTYQGPLEDPYIAAYNHKTKQWLGPFKAGTSDMGKDPARKNKIDNHGKPAILIDDEEYIHIVFGGHGGMPEHGKNTLGNYHYGKMKHVVSKRPLDITGWETLDNIPPFGTYTQWVKMDDGTIYLFYRHGAHRSNWVYQKSTDNARSFGEPVSVLKTKVSTGLAGRDAWYARFVKAKENTIAVNFNFHMCWNNSKERRHTGERRDGYYMYMNTQDEIWRNVKGEQLSMPLSKEHADEKALVLESKDLWSNVGAVGLDNDGNPHMTFRMGAHQGRQHGGPQRLYYMRWNGNSWVGGQDTDLPVSRGEIVIKSPTEINLWLVSRDENRSGELAIWQSQDGGDNFSKQKILLTQANSSLAMTSFIRNAHPEAQVMVSSKIKGSDRRRMFLVGDKGPVRRASRDKP